MSLEILCWCVAQPEVCSHVHTPGRCTPSPTPEPMPASGFEGQRQELAAKAVATLVDEGWEVTITRRGAQLDFEPGWEGGR